MNNISEVLRDQFEKGNFVKAIVSRSRVKGDQLQQVIIKPIKLKEITKLSFVYRNRTNDITKNHTIDEGVELFKDLLDSKFLNCNLMTTDSEFIYISNKKGKTNLKRKQLKKEMKVDLNHDHKKKRDIVSDNNIYFRELGISNAKFEVKREWIDKVKQINRYIEIIDGVIGDIKLDSGSKIFDMGSGKGYLTFALYDYLKNSLAIEPELYGVEMRQDLVDETNRIAELAQFDKLKFIGDLIENVDITDSDLMIALHACNTATDDAIFKGLSSGCRSIVVAPCCYKQVRRSLDPSNILQKITKYGIVKERQAEILTDTIRAMVLEAFGYKTNVIEFISSEHTPKNILIVAVKKGDLDRSKFADIEKLMEIYGLKKHHLYSLVKG